MSQPSPKEDFDLHFGMIGEWKPRVREKKEPNNAPQEEETKKADP